VSRHPAIPWILATLALALTCGEVAVAFAEQGGLPFNASDQSAWIDYLEPLLFTLVGALIAWKRPENSVGWLLLAYSLARALTGFVASYGMYGATHPESVPAADFFAWLSVWTWSLPIVLIPLVLLHFPDGRLPSPGWRWARWLCSLPAVLMLGPAVAWYGEPASRFPAIEDGSFLGEDWVGPVLTVMFASLLLSMLVALTSLVVRYRRSLGPERQQLKWVLLATAILAVQGIWEIFLPGPGDLLAALGAIAFAAIPASMAIAILRYRLYDIDRIINRAIVYAVVTGSLVAVYAGTVFVIGTVAIGRDDNLTVAVATLVAAAAFRPLLRRVQAFVDRRFYRHKYDAQRTIDAFGSRLREETDLSELTSDLVGVVRRTVQPTHVSVWIRKAGSEP
jgi:hypothetical protein